MEARAGRKRRLARGFVLVAVVLLLAATPCYFRGASAVELAQVTLAPGDERSFTHEELTGVFGYLGFHAEGREGELVVSVRSPPEREEAVTLRLPLGELGERVVPPLHLVVLETPAGEPLTGHFRWVEFHRWLSTFWSRRSAEFVAQLALFLLACAAVLSALARRERTAASADEARGGR